MYTRFLGSKHTASCTLVFSDYNNIIIIINNNMSHGLLRIYLLGARHSIYDAV